MSNYAEINPQLTYNKKTNSQNSYDPSYSMCQQDFSNAGSNYYHGGYSELMSRAIQIEETPLSREYFSKKNIEKIQKQLKAYVYRKTDGKFRLDVDQDENDLLIMMRSTFMGHAKFVQTNINEQIAVLNRKTIEMIAPDLIQK